MKVAALYDVHGMPHALDAVLDEVAREGFDCVLFGGDLIVGPFPERRRSRGRASWTARASCAATPSASRGSGTASGCAATTCAGSRDWPFSASIDGVLVLPRDAAGRHLDHDRVHARRRAAARAFGGVDERVVVIGHTHHQFERRAGDVRVVNAGSVGMPYEGEVAAFWLAVEDGEPSFRKTAFDVERAIADIRASGWPAPRSS